MPQIGCALLFERAQRRKSAGCSPCLRLDNMDSDMAKAALITVTCPCCKAELHIDPKTSAVIRHKEHEKPREFADMEAAVGRFKGEAGRREDAFQKSVADHKVHQDVLSKKFDEMLKLAKENPNEPPPKRDIDFD